ncbi:MAG TPA: C4-type zinc ribbon domain-containing protein [Thermoanaerobaculia bacterium]|nr:C4-type zinc ribbon domain-containing protein [Thermoanaerobaculia bacterium]
MNQTLERLWELQKEMSHLAAKEHDLNSKPESFAVVDQEYQEAESERSGLTEKLELLSRERRMLERELQDGQEVLKKFQGQLMQVKNQQQYAAAWKEIDTSRRQVKEVEDNLLRKMTEIEETQKALEERQDSHSEVKARYDLEYEVWQSSLGDLRSEIEQIHQRIANVESTLPEPLKKEFYRIFKQRQGIAVSRVENDACSVCRFKIRSQVQQQLRRGEVITCEGCRRIFYYERAAS